MGLETQLAALSGAQRQLDNPSVEELGPAVPPIPETLADTGLPESIVEQIILKSLYFQGDILGRDLANSVGLKFSVIEGLIELLKHQHLVQVKRSLGMGNISAVYSLTESGRQHAREYLESTQYAGKVPVPLDQYACMVEQQKLPESWLTPEMLASAFRHMVVSDEVISRVGPAVNAGKSFLIYGQPGNGKTYLAEALFGLDPAPIYIPYAIEAQGMIIELFDPLNHQPIEEEAGGSILAFANQATYDQRWIKVRRPFIVSGGELDMSMLDLSFNPAAKFYSAPLQMKANNGIYLIDDFGRQRATPAEVLNRWIVPMEKRIDFLTFKNGSKMMSPFETFLIFSSNLQPSQLGDEAFLRRIQYKMLLKSPDEPEFRQIFDRFCAKNKLPFDAEVLDRFLAKHYRATGKRRRRCHPRDVVTHAMDLIRFEKRMWKLTDEVLDHAFETCFTDAAHDD